jgi:asparagine synthase (glutamine-hydrolysing)
LETTGMCGICGILTRGDGPRDLMAHLRPMVDAMRHRGPDDEGCLLADPGARPAESYGGDDTAPAGVPVAPPGRTGAAVRDAAGQAGVPAGDPTGFARVPAAEPIGYPRAHWRAAAWPAARVALGHRRLAIIDLSPLGHQPMCTPDRRYWIVYNGELYNYREVARELEAAGTHFLGHSDTEVLLAAYAVWGPACLQRLIGMFAFAIWDDHEKSLFCARDRIGIKPFYYHAGPELFLFASDIKTILAAGLYAPRVDPEALYHCLTLGVAPRPLTCFDSLRALEQGHWLKLSADGRLRKERYWRLPVGTQDQGMSETDAVAQLEQALLRAVERRLIADVDVGTFMSGGADSTTVSAMAAHSHPGIQAFTLGFSPEYTEMDELEQAKATAAMHPMTHRIRVVHPEAILGHVREMIRCYEEPFFSLSPNYVISQFVAEHGLKVILNGLGGDELFCGYPHYRWARRWPWLRFAAPFTRPLAGAGIKWAQPHELCAARSPEAAYVTLYGHEPQSRKRRLYTDGARDFDTPRRIHELYNPEGMGFTDIAEAFNYLDMMHYVGNHHVYRTDQFTMRFGIEGRVPLLDHELVELAFRIPTKLKMRAGQLKYVLRRVAERWIHPSCLSMRKRGFSLAVHRWIDTDLRELVETSLGRLKQRGLFAPAAVDRTWAEVRSHAAPYSSVWQLVATELWLEEMFDRHWPQSPTGESGSAPASRQVASTKGQPAP